MKPLFRTRVALSTMLALALPALGTYPYRHGFYQPPQAPGSQMQYLRNQPGFQLPYLEQRGPGSEWPHAYPVPRRMQPEMDVTTPVAGMTEGMSTIQGAFAALASLGLYGDLWPKNWIVSDGATFDFVIVGAGTAGCVLANRLTELPNISVLVIEAGGDPPLEAVLPGLYPFLKKTKADWNHTSEVDGFTERFHKNHVTEITRGKMLGGSSSINYMVYNRGNAHDYDTWADITGDPAWSWRNVLPYFKKSENMLSRGILESKFAKYHGTDGLMKVTKSKNDSFTDYLHAFEELGHNLVEDISGDEPLGFSTPFVNVADGKRQGTAFAFLSKAKDRPNLHVLKNALVTKLIIDMHNNVKGVKVSVNNETILVYADKEVVVSAGAINSPQLLLLSGIGPRKMLEELNIEVKADLPVGQSLTDHVVVMIIHKTRPIIEQPPSLNPEENPSRYIEGYVALEKNQSFPDYQTFNSVIRDPQSLFQTCSFYFHYIDELCLEYYDMGKGHELLLSSVILINPQSRGQVLLKTLDAKDHPRIFTRYYSKQQDLEEHAKYLQDFLKVSNSSYFKSVGAELLVPKTCGCSRADSNFYRCYARCMMVSGYHFVGSVAMGAVLDSRLRVQGVGKLRVADASVMPKIPSANTHAPTVMVGERAADIIKEDHGLRASVMN